MTIDFALLDTAIEDAATGAGGYWHNQVEWLAPAPGHTLDQCGTAMCLAGFIAVRTGSVPPAPTRRGTAWIFPAWRVDPTTGTYDFNGGMRVSEYAAREVGLDRAQAIALFAADNTLDDIRLMRDHLRINPDADTSDLIDAKGMTIDA